jgi:hypothetical protein
MGRLGGGLVCSDVAEEFSRTRNHKRKSVSVVDRPVVAWDTEGMNLSGNKKPQHSVIFGSSAAEPLIGRDLGTMDMLEHIIQVGQANPHAIHVGYGFRYDANMIIKDFSIHQLLELWENATISFNARGWRWKLRWIPGKWLSVTRYTPGKRCRYVTEADGTIRNKGRDYRYGEGESVTIYDYSSFFGGNAFLKTCEQILEGKLTAEDRDVIAVGKAKRGSNSWSDLPEVLHYWRCEIQLIRRTMEQFKTVMCNAGMALKHWYGPGALANYLLEARKMHPHLAAAQTTQGIMPPEVHAASKYAFAGGRFEMFRAGRVKGPIHVYDINSAYPYALTQIPSLAADAGAWVHDSTPVDIQRFGVYRISFKDPKLNPFEYRPMPLFSRNHMGLVTFPHVVDGWYMSPETLSVQGMPGVTIHEGWYWEHEETYPWRWLLEMYETRQRIGKDKISSLPFKLGPNSIYGKLAQTVGWDKKTGAPPKSHALILAAWVTSYCRAMLWAAMMRTRGGLVAVETDSVVTTDELDLNIGDGLGQWGHTVYDEMMYVQSGLYHARVGDKWVVNKTRGLDRADFTTGQLQDWLTSLVPGEYWEPLEVNTKPRFIGLGFALASNRNTKEYHRVWETQRREITLGESGKRIHVMGQCPHCAAGIPPAEDAHPLVIAIDPFFNRESYPRALPWERAHPREVLEMQADDRAEAELISA